MYNYINHKQKTKQRYNRFHVISDYTMKIDVDNNKKIKNAFFYDKKWDIKMENSNYYEQFLVDMEEVYKKIEIEFEPNYSYLNKLIKNIAEDAFKIKLFLTQGAYFPIPINMH